jgi:hypothetical protein
MSYDTLCAGHVAPHLLGSQRQRGVAVRHPHCHPQAFKLEEQLQARRPLNIALLPHFHILFDLTFSFQRRKPVEASPPAHG